MEYIFTRESLTSVIEPDVAGASLVVYQKSSKHVSREKGRILRFVRFMKRLAGLGTSYTLRLVLKRETVFARENRTNRRIRPFSLMGKDQVVSN